MRRKSSVVALAVVVIAMMLTVIAVIDEPRHQLWFGLALLSLDAAFFIVLAQNAFDGAPIQTRGGPVNRKSAPIFYVAAYGVMVLIGLIAGLVVLTTLVLPGN